MDILKISGGIPLNGSVDVSGSKNAAMKLIIASILSDKRCVFFNVPDAPEVADVLKMCQEIGMEYVWDRFSHILEVCTKELKTTYIPQKFSGSNRIPILMVGALLSRAEGEIVVPFNAEGSHDEASFDFHIEALRSLGVSINLKKTAKEGTLYASCGRGLKGNVITLPFPSLGATENAILAAVTAHGTTIIRNAAVDPEVIELMLFLQKLGASLSLDTDRVITIQGVRFFHPVEHAIFPDRIETAFFASIALATNGRICVRGVQHEYLITLLNTIREIGGSFTVTSEGIEFFKEGPLQGGIHIETESYPGFITDWQPFFTILLTQAHKASIVHETVFHNSFGYVDALSSMGATISLFRQCLGGRSCRFNNSPFPHSIIIQGETSLHGSSIAMPDVRAPLAYVLAALIAQGESVITGIFQTHEPIFEKLRSVGAKISGQPMCQKGIPDPIDLFSFANKHFETKKT